jgi:hypothetical protein
MFFFSFFNFLIGFALHHVYCLLIEKEEKITFLPNPSAQGVTIQLNKLSFTQNYWYSFFIDKEITMGITRMFYSL